MGDLGEEVKIVEVPSPVPVEVPEQEPVPA